MAPTFTDAALSLSAVVREAEHLALQRFAILQAQGFTDAEVEELAQAFARRLQDLAERVAASFAVAGQRSHERSDPLRATAVPRRERT